MVLCNAVSRWAELLSFLCRMLNLSRIVIHRCNEVQLKLTLHQLWRMALRLSRLQQYFSHLR